MGYIETAAPWDVVRTGLKMMLGAWGALGALSIVNRLLWTLILAVMTAGGTGISQLSMLLGVFGFLMQVLFTGAEIVVAIGASRLLRFPQVQREAPMGDPYRGGGYGGRTPDPGLDGLAVGMFSAFVVTAVLGLGSYLYSTVSPPIGRDPGFTAHDALWVLEVLVSLAATAIFVLWSVRAGRAVGRPIPAPLPVAVLIALVLRTGLSLARTFAGLTQKQHPWLPWVSLLLNVAELGASVALTLRVLDSVREQPQR